MINNINSYDKIDFTDVVFLGTSRSILKDGRERVIRFPRHGFTINKTYTIENSKCFTISGGNPGENCHYIELRDDFGISQRVEGAYFCSLEDYRDYKINKILDDKYQRLL